MAVDDHGIEALKKAAEEVTPGSKADYYFKMGLLLGGLPISGGNPLPVSGSFTVSSGGKTKVALARIDYSGTPVTTSAYTTLVASLTDTVNQLYIFDSSGQTLLLAVGAAASEVDQIYIVPGGNGEMNLTIPSGSRVSIKAVTATANSGEINVSFLK